MLAFYCFDRGAEIVDLTTRFFPTVRRYNDSERDPGQLLSRSSSEEKVARYMRVLCGILCRVCPMWFFSFVCFYFRVVYLRYLRGFRT